MLLYSMLFLTGYDLPLEQIKQFRQWGSHTPGHPERELTPGVETTTGPLGQGFGNGIGMAIAEAHLAARYNRPGFEIINHFTYAIVSDGDLMEGVAAEAASLAGHLKLGKLIYLYDNNRISLAGAADLSFNWSLYDGAGNGVLSSSSSASATASTSQDGYASGTYQNFSIDSNGIISAKYSNGRSSVVGQLAIIRGQLPAEAGERQRRVEVAVELGRRGVVEDRREDRQRAVRVVGDLDDARLLREVDV